MQSRRPPIFFKNRDLGPQVKIALSDAMDELPLIQGTILRAIYWQGLSVKEVARQLKTTVTSVRTTKSKALKKLKRVLSLKKLKVTFGPRESSTISEG